MGTTEISIEPVAGSAMLLDSYPVERYRALRDGEMSVEEFIDDLIRHVDVSLAKDALLVPIS